MIKSHWPGDLTIIYKGQAYRKPNHPIILKIIESIGPIWCSSANISGRKPIKKISDIKVKFKEHLGEIIAITTNIIPTGTCSTIYDFDKKEIVREGRIKKSNLFS